MPYGINIFDTNGNSTIAGLATEFVVETLRPTSTGSKAYPLSAGESLRVNRFFGFQPGVGRSYFTGVSVSGNTISWSVEHDPHSTFPLVEGLMVTKVVT